MARRLLILILFIGITSTTINWLKPNKNTVEPITTHNLSKSQKDSLTAFLMGQCTQATLLIIEVTECGKTIYKYSEQLKALTGISITKKNEIDLLKFELSYLWNWQLKFYSYLKDLYIVEELLDQWADYDLATPQTLQQDEIAEEILKNDAAKRFLNLDFNLLTVEWKRLNLNQRTRAYSKKLSDLIAHQSYETISEAELMSTFKMKQEIVKSLILMLSAVNDILKEIRTEINNAPTYLEIPIVASSFKGIRQEYGKFLIKVDAGHKTLKKAYKLLLQTGKGVAAKVKLSDEIIKEAYEYNSELLRAEWHQLNLIQRAIEFLAELRAGRTGEGKFIEHTYEL